SISTTPPTNSTCVPVSTAPSTAQSIVATAPISLGCPDFQVSHLPVSNLHLGSPRPAKASAIAFWPWPRGSDSDGAENARRADCGSARPAARHVRRGSAPATRAIGFDLQGLRAHHAIPALDLHR